jgi:hypothetical protein
VQSNVFYPSPTTRYQLKTGSSFKPWQPSQLKKELFGSSRRPVNRKNLAEGVCTCLQSEGTYVLVCFGIDLVDPQRRKAKAAIVSLLTQCGFTSPNVDVWGIKELITYLEVYPGLCLEVSRHQDRFIPHTMWARTEEMQRPYQKNDARERAIDGLRSSLREQRATHIRVCGEPGVGKTRFVLEVTREERLAPAVTYWASSEEFFKSLQFHDIQSDYANYAAILVIDECDFDNASRIWNVLKRRPPSMPTIQLITLHHEFDDHGTSSDVFYPKMEPLEIEEITAILRSYGAPQEIAIAYGHLCSGSPRVAHIVGENLKQNAPTLTSLPRTMGEVWIRYVSGRHSRDSDITIRTKFILQYISLFTKLGFEAPVKHEADAVFQLVHESDPTIGRGIFDEVIRTLRNRRILQGEKTLYISPKLFHIWLWSECWETHGSSLEVIDFAKRLPTSLFGWFGEMFRYAQGYGKAVSQAIKLLGPRGPFASGEFIRSEMGANFFLPLAEATPREAITCLERFVGTWDERTLEAFTTGRREVVWALEKIVFYPELFDRAASLLLLLAETENETWGNNATGVFKQLFTLAGGDVAPTAASPSERIPTLVEAVNSNSKRRRSLSLEACKVLLDTNWRPRAIRSVPFAIERVEPYRPSSRQELLDAITSVWKLVETKASNLPEEDEREHAQTILIQEGMSLLRINELSDMVLETVESFADSNDRIRKVLTKQLLDIFRFHENWIPEGMKGRLTALRDKLSGGDFASTLRRYTGIFDWHVSLEKEEESKLAEILRSLAEQSVASPQLLVAELPWATSPEAENAYPFGVELGKADTKHILLPFFLDAYRSAGEKVFLGLLAGYLKPVYESHLELWEKTLDLMVSDSRLSQLVPETTWRTGITDRAGERVLGLATSGVIGPEHLKHWAFGTEIRKLSPAIFHQWLKYLLDCEPPSGRLIGLDLFHRYYCDKEARAPMPPELAKTFLLHPDFFASRQRMGMDDYNWSELAKRLIAQEPSFSVKVLEVVLGRWDSYDSPFIGKRNEPTRILYQIVKDQPEKSWEVIASLVKELKGVRTWSIMDWFQGYVPFDEDTPFS